MSEKKLRILLGDTKENVKAALNSLDEAVKHIPAERFRMTISIIEQAKDMLTHVVEEIERELSEEK